ncbi:DUF4190 domain-containing protein [Arthrobacter koreensis]|uniref:DUF4190 domain-containing protein n=1 Tax=Arthrobacter koreensis TaxID=199136 RepID=UPI002DBD827A|nr:hypothetical protein [Arthrobacter koreensis]MEB7449279.1 hypothetical protein [Arthrobacter koreensis]
MSDNRNDVPGGPAGEPQEQPWAKPSGDAAPDAPENTPGDGAPTQPLYGSYESAGGGASSPDAPASSATENHPSAPETAPGAWAQPNQHGQPQPPYGQQAPGQQPTYGTGYGVPPAPYGYPGNYQAPAQQPGKTMGIVGLILSCLFFIPFASLVGVILSIVGLVQSRKAKMSNGPALAGIIIGGVVFILTLIATIAIFVFAVDQVGTLFEVCEDLGPGTHFVDGEIYECGVDSLQQSL